MILTRSIGHIYTIHHHSELVKIVDFTYTDFSGSKLPEDKTLSNSTLVLLSSFK